MWVDQLCGFMFVAVNDTAGLIDKTQGLGVFW